MALVHCNNFNGVLYMGVLYTGTVVQVHFVKGRFIQLGDTRALVRFGFASPARTKVDPIGPGLPHGAGGRGLEPAGRGRDRRAGL